MEKPKNDKKLLLISKSIDEETLLDLKDFFRDPNKYLESKSKFIVGNKNLFKLKSPLSLNKKIKNFSRDDLIDLQNKEINDFSLKEKSLKKGNYSLSKMKKYHKEKIKNKSISSLTPKQENIFDKINKDILTKKNILIRNKFSFNNDDINKNDLEKNNLSLKPKDIHYEFKTKKEILELFKKFLAKKKNKKDLIYRPFSSQKPSFPPKRKLSFKDIIKTNEEEKKNFNNFSNYLSRKCDREKKNLLVNRIDDFNMKKYMSNYMQENKLFSERLGNKYWICNLRRSQTKNEHKINFVITGRGDKEPWEQIIDSGIIEPEYVNDPSTQEKNIKSNINTLDEYKLFKQKFPFLNSFNNLKIEGKNLLERELSNFSINSSKNQNIKYRLYKDPREFNIKCIKEMIYKQNYILPSRNKINLKIKSSRKKI